MQSMKFVFNFLQGKLTSSEVYSFRTLFFLEKKKFLNSHVSLWFQQSTSHIINKHLVLGEERFLSTLRKVTSDQWPPFPLIINEMTVTWLLVIFLKSVLTKLSFRLWGKKNIISPSYPQTMKKHTLKNHQKHLKIFLVKSRNFLS